MSRDLLQWIMGTTHHTPFYPGEGATRSSRSIPLMPRSPGVQDVGLPGPGAEPMTGLPPRARMRGLRHDAWPRSCWDNDSQCWVEQLTTVEVRGFFEIMKSN